MTLFLMALSAVVLYGLLCLVSPHKTCPKCKGKRVWKKRGCPRCKVRGKVQRPGARLVARIFWSMAGDGLRDRRKARLKGDSDGAS
jgi:DnaJ-class molecular chaperone